MTELLLRRAREIAADAILAETSLLIVARGTDLNENSAVAHRLDPKRGGESIRVWNSSKDARRHETHIRHACPGAAAQSTCLRQRAEAILRV